MPAFPQPSEAGRSEFALVALVEALSQHWSSPPAAFELLAEQLPHLLEAAAHWGLPTGHSRSETQELPQLRCLLAAHSLPPAFPGSGILSRPANSPCPDVLQKVEAATGSAASNLLTRSAWWIAVAAERSQSDFPTLLPPEPDFAPHAVH